MRKLLPILVLVFVLAACIPQVGESTVASLAFERDEAGAVATLSLDHRAREVLVIFRGGGVEEREEFPTLPAGNHRFIWASTDPVACVVSGYVGAQYFLLFCE